jgi:hypothetical protein
MGAMDRLMRAALRGDRPTGETAEPAPIGSANAGDVSAAESPTMGSIMRMAGRRGSQGRAAARHAANAELRRMSSGEG